MKFIAATIFVLLILTQTCSKWLLLLDYTVNRDYIAKNLCENQNTPALNCKGNCQLMKKLAAEENHNNNTTPVSSLIKVSFSEMFVETDFITQFFPIKELTGYSGIYLTALPSSFVSSIFHPPCA